MSDVGPSWLADVNVRGELQNATEGPREKERNKVWVKITIRSVFKKKGVDFRSASTLRNCANARVTHSIFVIADQLYIRCDASHFPTILFDHLNGIFSSLFRFLKYIS